MRLALAQINTVVGDLDGNRERILAALAEARSRGRRDRPASPSSRSPATRPRICCCVRGSSAPPRSRCSRSPPRRADIDRARRAPRGSTATSSTPARSAGRRGEGPLPQALPAQLRRLRRGPLLRAGPRPDPAPARRDPRRTDHLRGHLAARPSRHRPRTRRRGAARQPLGVALLRRQGGGPRGDARHARARQLRLPRLLQPRRRAGRAALRRPLGRPGRRGRGARARARLRGGAARRRSRPERGDRPAPPRRPSPRAGAGA